MYSSACWVMRVGGGPSREMVFSDLCHGPGQPSQLLFLGLPACFDPQKCSHSILEQLSCVYIHLLIFKSLFVPNWTLFCLSSFCSRKHGRILGVNHRIISLHQDSPLYLLSLLLQCCTNGPRPTTQEIKALQFGKQKLNSLHYLSG